MKLLSCLRTALCLLGVLAMPAAAAYPEKPINMIIAFTAGGSSDVQARIMQKYWNKYAPQPWVFVYKPGAGGIIGFTEIAKARPDGYTIGGLNVPHIILQPLAQPPEQERCRQPTATAEQIGRDPLFQGADEDEDLALVLPAQVAQHRLAAARVVAEGVAVAHDQLTQGVADAGFHGRCRSRWLVQTAISPSTWPRLSRTPAASAALRPGSTSRSWPSVPVITHFAPERFLSPQRPGSLECCCTAASGWLKS